MSKETHSRLKQKAKPFIILAVLQRSMLRTKGVSGAHLSNYTVGLHVACLHDQNKSGFLAGRLLSSQLEQFEKFSKDYDWLEKSRPSKKATFVFIM